MMIRNLERAWFRHCRQLLACAIADRHRDRCDLNRRRWQALYPSFNDDLPGLKRRSHRDTIDAAFKVEISVVGRVFLPAVVAAAPDRRAFEREINALLEGRA